MKNVVATFMLFTISCFCLLANANAQAPKAVVQVATVHSRTDADQIISVLKKKGYSVALRTTWDNHAKTPIETYQVLVGPFANQSEAEDARRGLSSNGWPAIVTSAALPKATLANSVQPPASREQMTAVVSLAQAPTSTQQTEQISAGPSLDETVAWLKEKIETFAGGVQINSDSGMKDSGIHRSQTKEFLARNNVHATYGSQVCVLHVAWHRHYLREDELTTEYAPGYFATYNSSKAIDSNVSMDIPLYFLKTATVIKSSTYNDAVLRLSFDGKKAVNHVHGAEHDRSNIGKADEDSKDQPIDEDAASDMEEIPFQRDRTQDTVELEGRVAAAFSHLRDICASQRPKSNEPF